MTQVLLVDDYPASRRFLREVLDEIGHEFLEAQKQMIRASTEIRARQKDMAETWSEAWQMPTRTEVDDLTLMVYQLRRELREVKRELANLKGSAK